MSVPSQLSVIAAASTAASPADAVTENSLVVVEYPGEKNWRVYWKGKRVGTVDTSRPIVRSITNPRFAMLIGGCYVQFGNKSDQTATFAFQGELLTNHGGGFRVGYDAAADRPVF